MKGKDGEIASLRLLLGSIGLQFIELTQSSIGDFSTSLITISGRVQHFGGKINQATFITHLIYSLNKVRKLKNFSRQLLEHWSERPLAEILESVQLEGVTPVTELGFAQAALDCAPIESEEVFRLASEIAIKAKSLLNKSFLFNDRRDLLDRIRQTWPKLKAVALARADFLVTSQGDEQGAEQCEKILLDWSEEFENRLLADEFLLEEPDYDSATKADALQLLPGKSPMIGEWSTKHLAAWREAWNTAANVNVAACIGEVASPILQKKRQPLQRSSRKNPDHLGWLASTHFHPAAAIPEGCVLLRGMFDEEGGLHTWTYINHNGDLSQIGRSKASGNCIAASPRKSDI